MTELGTCKSAAGKKAAPHKQNASCVNWRPLSPSRVEIWRYNDTTLVVARSDGATWNGPDTMFTGVRHDGLWDSEHMAFRLPDVSPAFSDGVPVAIYEGLETLADAD